MSVAEAQPTLSEARRIFLGVDAYHQMIDAGIFSEEDRAPTHTDWRCDLSPPKSWRLCCCLTCTPALTRSG